VVFKQIAGLIARRIVFTKQPGDLVAKGERVGLIKFGSRVDVLFGPEWQIAVQPGVRVAAGSSVIALRRDFAGADLAEARELVVETRELVHAEA
jgi:phosphatidylserine decarboxylase